MQTIQTATRSARIAFLATPQFKEQLHALAQEENISVGALIRARFEQPAEPSISAEERTLAALAAELRTAVADARAALDRGIGDVQAALAAITESRAADTQ